MTLLTTPSIKTNTQKRLKRPLLQGAVATLTSAALLTGCASTTGANTVDGSRKQLLLVSSQQVQQMAGQSYQQLIKQARAQGKLDTNPAQVARLKRIADRLIAQVGAYRQDASGWSWEVHTVKSNELNAFVLPGGKIVFYTGIIDRLNLTDAQIAAIMGHEMAHALREHLREQLSRQYATQTSIGIAASVFGLSQNEAQLAGLAGDLGINRPHNRAQESEADAIGLNLMARAGYDPRAAVSLWQKMQQASQGEPPQFLSTHPNSSSRIANLRARLPKEMPVYQRSQHQ